MGWLQELWHTVHMPYIQWADLKFYLKPISRQKKNKVFPCSGAGPALHRLTACSCQGKRRKEIYLPNPPIPPAQDQSGTPMLQRTWVVDVPDVMKLRAGSIDQEQSTTGQRGSVVFRLTEESSEYKLSPHPWTKQTVDPCSAVQSHCMGKRFLPGVGL